MMKFHNFLAVNVCNYQLTNMDKQHWFINRYVSFILWGLCQKHFLEWNYIELASRGCFSMRWEGSFRYAVKTNNKHHAIFDLTILSFNGRNIFVHRHVSSWTKQLRNL